MGPTIILDKSAIQALSQREIHFLVKHFFVVVTPLLIMEILADLKKGNDEGRLSKDEVIQLSKKLLPDDSRVNTNYNVLCYGSLRGQDIPMMGQAIVSGGIPIKVPEGKEGVFFDESPEEKALRNWRNGIFSDAEEILAQEWREATGAVNLEFYKKRFKELFKNVLKIKDLKELSLLVERFILNPDTRIQFSCITGFMDELMLPQQDKDIICNRWLKRKIPLFRDFAPYAYFCFKINIIFYVGLALGLISTKPTNILDLGYLYYLPFCTVFCSGDKFHIDVCPILLRNDQDFIERNSLKDDLHWLSTEWDSLSEAEKEDRAYHYGSYPPVNNKSVTYQLWKKHMKPWKPGSGNMVVKMTKEEQDQVIAKLEPMLDEIEKVQKFKDKKDT